MITTALWSCQMSASLCARRWCVDFLCIIISWHHPPQYGGLGDQGALILNLDARMTHVEHSCRVRGASIDGMCIGPAHHQSPSHTLLVCMYGVTHCDVPSTHAPLCITATTMRWMDTIRRFCSSCRRTQTTSCAASASKCGRNRMHCKRLLALVHVYLPRPGTLQWDQTGLRTWSLHTKTIGQT